MGIRKYLGVAFLAGLFLIGIGGGVTFVEFSSFQLGEERVIGNEFMETNVIRETIPQESEPIYVVLDGVSRRNVEIVADSSMRDDEIEIQAEYNAKALYTYSDMYEDDNELHVRYYDKDLYWLNYMDDILTSIKHKKIPNYQWEYYGKHVIRVAPENRDRLVVYN